MLKKIKKNKTAKKSKKIFKEVGEISISKGLSMNHGLKNKNELAKFAVCKTIEGWFEKHNDLLHDNFSTSLLLMIIKYF